MKNLIIIGLLGLVYFLGYQKYVHDTGKIPTMTISKTNDKKIHSKYKRNSKNKIKRYRGSNKFTIHGLGDFDRSSLEYAKRIMKEEFNIDAEISDPVDIKYSEMNSDGEILSSKVSVLDRPGSHIFVTNQKLRDEENVKLSGIRRLKNLIITDLSKRPTTLMHEYAHSLFLKHCENSECIMYYIESGANKFCDECYEKLKEKLKK